MPKWFNNEALDSNGNMYINGIIIAAGTDSPDRPRHHTRMTGKDPVSLQSCTNLAEGSCNEIDSPPLQQRNLHARSPVRCTQNQYFYRPILAE